MGDLGSPLEAVKSTENVQWILVLKETGSATPVFKGRLTLTGWANFVCLLVGCLASQQQASVSQGHICSENCICRHTETEAADQVFNFNQLWYTDTQLTSPTADPIMPGPSFHHRYDLTWKNPCRESRNRTLDLPPSR